MSDTNDTVVIENPLKNNVVVHTAQVGARNNVDSVNISDALRERYNKLFQDGYLVNIHVSVWGMSANLSEDDLKIQKVSKFIKLGKKMLIDPEQLNVFKNIESKGRRYLYKNSYDFPIADAHFVPKKRLSAVFDHLDEIRGEFYAQKRDFLANYETYKEAVLEHEEYKDIKEVLRSLYPTVADLEHKFAFSTSVFELTMPRALEETNIQDLISRDQAEVEVKKKLEAQLADQHRRSLQQIDRFAEDAVQSLRGQLFSACEAITQKIKSGEIVSKSNISSIKAEIANFHALNFLDDTAVSSEIERLEKLLDGAHNFKTDKNAVATLDQALKCVMDKTDKFSDVSTIRGKYFRKFNV